MGETVADTREANPGEVWEENEFWIELSWRIDPDGSLGIRKFFESPSGRARSSRSTSTTAGSSRTRCRACREGGAEGLTPLEYMRRTAPSRSRGASAVHEQEVPEDELDDVRGRRPFRPRALHARARSAGAQRRPAPTPDGDAEGRRPVGVRGRRRGAARLPDAERPARVLLDTLAAGAGPSTPARLHPRATSTPRGSRPDQMPLISTFRLPVQIHTRSATPSGSTRSRTPTRSGCTDRRRAARRHRTGDLVRVETEIGHFVVKAWVTEGIRPGVVACSHHMGRWKLGDGRASAR
jgi:anaerobic selenocysteine-containing dehydrogenase